MSTRPKHSNGFTLIELIITVAIISIIAAIAIPAYNGYIHTARMTEGMNDLSSLRLVQLEFFEENNTFFCGADTATLVANSVGRWQPSEWLRVGQDQTLLNFMYSIDCGGGNTGDIASSYIALANGQNDVDAAVQLSTTQ